MDSDLTPINGRPKRRVPEAVEDLSLALREHVVWPLEDRYMAVQDRLLALGRLDQALLSAAALLVAAVVGVGGFLLVASHGSESREGSEVAVRVAPPPAPAPRQQATAAKPAPTLHGAAPTFKAPKGKAPTEINGAVPIGGAPASSQAPAASGSAATAKISSKPGGRGAPATASSLQGPSAGPAALAVAREFADAFVVYETGGESDTVRKGFAETATPELRRALLERPPRQPATVRVPKAKVLNVVAAPSHGRVFPVSVALLRVGVTSELRLELERLKNKRWRVVNVLG